MGFVIVKTSIEGLIHIQPKVYGDTRGYFLETYNRQAFKDLGLDMIFLQDNESKSSKGVLRGLHFQQKYPQGKLVRCSSGKVFDVAVDLRPNSETFGQWESVILDSKKKNMFYIPEGFAHGFLALTDDCVFSYKCTDYYHPEDESGIIWDDPDLGIQWTMDAFGILEPTISDKDYLLKTFSEFKMNN